MDKISLIATATFGMEGIVTQELKDLGMKEITTHNGYVEFSGEISDICKSNILLRCADRVFLKLGEFRVTSFEELYQNVKKIDWGMIIPIDAKFPVSKVSSVRSKLFSKSDIQSISKKAIVDSLQDSYNKQVFPETGAEFPIKVQLLNDNVIVSIDTSGAGLHKRGYRKDNINYSAPIKETLAAGLVKISRWKGKKPLLDLTCGTGTILIEAAMMAKNIAPGVNRRFISEEWDFIPEKLWIDERDRAFSNEKDIELDIMGIDIDKNCIEAAKDNAIKAEVSEDIRFIKKDLNDFKNFEKLEKGVIISNPPYGDRISDKNSIQKLYKEMGEVINRELKDWSSYIITSHEEFESYFGKSANKNRKLYNGGIKCYYYQYFGKR